MAAIPRNHWSSSISPRERASARSSAATCHLLLVNARNDVISGSRLPSSLRRRRARTGSALCLDTEGPAGEPSLRQDHDPLRRQSRDLRRAALGGRAGPWARQRLHGGDSWLVIPVCADLCATSGRSASTTRRAGLRHFPSTCALCVDGRWGRDRLRDRTGWRRIMRRPRGNGPLPASTSALQQAGRAGGCGRAPSNLSVESAATSRSGA